MKKINIITLLILTNTSFISYANIEPQIYLRNRYRKPIYIRINNKDDKPVLIATGQQALLGSRKEVYNLEIKAEGSSKYANLNDELRSAKSRCFSGSHSWITIPDTSNPFQWAEPIKECVPFRNSFTDLDVKFLSKPTMTGADFFTDLTQEHLAYNTYYQNYYPSFAATCPIAAKVLQLSSASRNTLMKTIEEIRQTALNSKQSFSDQVSMFHFLAMQAILIYNKPCEKKYNCEINSICN